ncbi:MAG: amidohydrolase family protein [Candidatus Aminicenantes bacterium]|nr:amidohydrolase family protein [Candidatus Aminicenantes bacterium]
MRKKTAAFLSIITIALLASMLGAVEITVIKAGKLIDPAEAAVRDNIIILIEGNTIKEMGPDVKIPENANIIDLSGCTVLPGLFDCHTHLCQMIPVKGTGGYGFTAHYLLKTTPDRALQGVENGRTFLESGFTTVRDVGNAGHYADVALKQAIDQEKFPGPNMLVTGKIIAPMGGQLHVNFENLRHPDIDYIEADTRDEMKKGIRQNLHLGADWIKIVVDDQRYIYSADDIRFIVEEAAKAGVKVCAHCVTEQGARNAIEGGLASIEHGFVMSNEALKMAKEKGVWLCGTDFSREIWGVYGSMSYYPETVDRFKSFYPKIVDRLKRAYKIGVKMAFGSDIVVEVPGHTRGSAALTLLDTWLDAEIPPADILRAMTTNAAEMLEMDKIRGCIKSGMRADIIATPDNPLENIKTLRAVKFVMKDGKVYKHEK